MGLSELFVIAVGLSADAFSVSICKGLASKKMNWNTALICGVYFGAFQAIMPLIGYFLGYRFRGYITSIDHWIAFLLLALIGLNMIKESREESCEVDSGKTDFRTMTLLAIATSIDALAIGVTFAFLDVNIWAAVSFIGLCTFCFSIIGVKIGNAFGTRFQSKAELAGGLILVLMGIKILVEHLMGL